MTNFPILEDVMVETTAVAATEATNAAASDGVVLIEFARERFASMLRRDASDKGQWLASFLTNKLRLEPEGLDSLAEYMMQAGLELRRRSLEARSTALREATDAWRAAGCPGRAPVVEDRAVVRRDGPKAERSQEALAALLA